MVQMQKRCEYKYVLIDDMSNVVVLDFVCLCYLITVVACVNFNTTIIQSYPSMHKSAPFNCDEPKSAIAKQTPEMQDYSTPDLNICGGMQLRSSCRIHVIWRGSLSGVYCMSQVNSGDE